VTGVRSPVAPAEEGRTRVDGFWHDVHVTWFDSRIGRVVPLALGAGVAMAAVSLGPQVALALGALIAIGLATAVAVLERDRWHAQDLLSWYQAERMQRWRTDTGSDAPVGGPANAEIWLGAHQAGSVPQVYRAIAAGQVGDEAWFARELGALADQTLEDRAWRLWVVQARRLAQTGEADVRQLRPMVESLPDADDRASLSNWLAQEDAIERHSRGDPSWIQPLLQMWPHARRVPLGSRRQARLWLSRFIVVPAFAMTAVVLASIGLQLAGRGEAIPSEYARTSLYTRGDIPQLDSQHVASSLPALARSVSTATRLRPAALDAAQVADLIEAGLPTVIWEVGEIDLAPPPDLPGRRVWSVEVLLGALTDTDSPAIVTFDGAAGPSYLYRIDPQVLASLRAALGLPAAQSP
jgi:hypothetical protein